MDQLEKFLDWLGKYQEGIFIVGLIIGGIWKAYTHFTKDKQPVPNFSRENLEDDLQQILKKIREERQIQAGQNPEKLQLLEIEEKAAQARLENIEEALKEKRKLLAATDTALDRIAPGVAPDRLQTAKATLEKGETEEAENLFQEILEDKNSPLGHAAEATYRLGKLAEDRLDFKAAHDFLERAAGLFPESSEYLNAAGFIEYQLAEYDKAIGYFEKALKVNLNVNREEHPDTARDWNNLGSVWQEKGKLDKAIDYYEKALAVNLKVRGEGHPDTAQNWNNLGEAWRQKGEYDKAVDYYEKALKVDLAVHGEGHPKTAIRWNNLGSVWQAKGEYGKARDYYQKALVVLHQRGVEHYAKDVESNLKELDRLEGGD